MVVNKNTQDVAGAPLADLSLTVKSLRNLRHYEVGARLRNRR